MRVHEEFWVFVAEQGTAGAKHQARKRSAEGPGDDARWLLERAGVKARLAWLNLPEVTRAAYIASHPDGSFPDGHPSGEIDERRKRKGGTVRKHEAPGSTSSHAQGRNPPFQGKQGATMSTARQDQTSAVQDSAVQDSVADNVAACELARIRWLDAEYYAAVVGAQLESVGDPVAFVSASAIKRVLNIGIARAMMTLPAEYRDDMQLAMAGVVSMITAIPGAVQVSTVEELKDDKTTLDGALARAERVYCKTAARAIRACKAIGLPDPDPFIKVIPKPASHPDYTAVDASEGGRSDGEGSDCDAFASEEEAHRLHTRNRSEKRMGTAAIAVVTSERRSSEALEALTSMVHEEMKKPTPNKSAIAELHADCLAKEDNLRYAVDRLTVSASLNTALQRGVAQPELTAFNA